MTSMMAARASRMGLLCHRHYCYNLYSTAISDVQVPPLLVKLRSDLKAAMKAKDTNRLNVLRAILAETTNASKTTSPVRTDIQLLSLIRKRIAASKDAAEGFNVAKREDLANKEQAQMAVMEEYAATVQTVGSEEIARVVADVIGKMRTDGQTVNAGSALRALVGDSGAFEGRAVDKAEVARIVKGML